MIIARGTLLSAIFLIAVSSLGCENGSETITGADAVEPVFVKKGVTCPGHPSCPKDPPPEPPPPSGAETVDITGDATATGQPVIIEKDSKNHLVVGADQPGFADVLSFRAAAGNPTTDDLKGCVTDPADLLSTNPATVQRLIDRLDDDAQARGFRFKVNRRDPDNLTGVVIHTWFDDGDGHQYRTWVFQSFLLGGPGPTVTKHPTEETYTYTGGSIVSWDLDTNEQLACPNGGTVTVTLNR